MATLVRHEDIERWRADGWVAFDRPLIDDAGLALVRERVERLVRRWPDLPAGHAQDLGDPHGDQGSIPEINRATRLDPALLRTPAYRAARRLAQALLGCRHVRLHFDHLVVKLPGAPATAWHQDLAYDLDHDVPASTVWMPLVDVDAGNGAMQYVTGSHVGPLWAHIPHGPHALRAVATPAEVATAAVPAGGCAVHHVRTLHASHPNTGEGTRIAWVLTFMPDDRPIGRRQIGTWRERRRPVRARTALATRASPSGCAGPAATPGSRAEDPATA